MNVRSVVSSTRAPGTALTASVRRGQSAASAVSTVMSRIVWGPSTCDEVDRADRAPGVADRDWPPCPSMPGRWSISTRSVRLYWALGVVDAICWDLTTRQARGPLSRRPRQAAGPQDPTPRATARGKPPALSIPTPRVAARGKPPALGADPRPQDSLGLMADELFLIDGNSLAYRAFFALPESIATSTGVPTNAIFGFASMLVKILTDYGPKATVVVWDAGLLGPQGGLLRVQGPALAAVPTCSRSSGPRSSRWSRRSATAT